MKGARWLLTAAPLLVFLLPWLEDDLAAELEFAVIECAGYLSEVAVGKAGVDAVELGVVKGVEGFCAKFEMRILLAAEGNAFEQREIPVEEAGADDGVFAGGAKALVYATVPWSK